MDHFTYKDGVLHAEEVAIPAIAQTLGTPFYCYSTATLLRHFQVFRDALDGLNPLIFYAVKANDTLAVITTLARAGSGADVVSEGEIRMALAAGVPASKIVFSGIGKTRSEMEFALAQDIFQFNVESQPELRLLSQVASAAGKTANIALRVNPDVASGTHAKIATGHKESKFGVPMREALSLYAEAATLPGIRIQGVSVHIGSQLTDLKPFADAFARLVAFVGELRAAGHIIHTLDLGGGLGIPYGNTATPPTPAEYGALVKQATQGVNCQLMFEPGRLLVGNAGILVTRVVYVKRSEGRVFVVVDAGMNDLVRPTLYNAYHDILPVRDSGAAPKVPVDIVGPVCETGDVFALDRMLAVPSAGDLVALRTAGAYGAAMASTYNARPLLAEAMVNGSALAVVRKRQTFADLLARDTLPQWL
jgi:diaminopimelate decarboxylase